MQKVGSKNQGGCIQRASEMSDGTSTIPEREGKKGKRKRI